MVRQGEALEQEPWTQTHLGLGELLSTRRQAILSLPLSFFISKNGQRNRFSFEDLSGETELRPQGTRPAEGLDPSGCSRPASAVSTDSPAHTGASEQRGCLLGL